MGCRTGRTRANSAVASPGPPAPGRPARAARGRRKRHFAAAAALGATLLLASLPYLYGAAIRPPGTRFWAVPPVNSSDANQYLAFTRMAAEGRILFGDPFTGEPHEPRLFLPQTLLQGALCRLLAPGRGDPIAALEASRVLSGAALLAAGWWLGLLHFRSWRLRWLFLGLLCLSGGAGWILERTGLDAPHGDFLQPEGNTLSTLGNLPHLALSSALLTALFASLRALEREVPARRPLLLSAAAGLSLLLAWTHPFDFLALLLGLGTYALYRWRTDRRIPVSSLSHGAAVALGALPAALYLLWITRTDPVYRELASDTLRVQGFWFYASAHGLLALPALAVLAAPELRRRLALPLCWVVPVFLFLLLPFPLGGKQCRVLGGVHVPLAILAAAGVDAVAGRLARRLVWPGAAPARRRAALAAAWLALCAPGGLLLVWQPIRFYTPPAPAFYLPAGIQELFRVLDREGSEQELMLGGSYSAGWAPTWAATRVFHGHWHMTLREPEKRAERDWFFLSDAAPEQKAEWLRRRGVTWVLRWPWEWGGQAAPLDSVPGLRLVRGTAEAQLYRFAPGGSASGRGAAGTLLPREPKAQSRQRRRPGNGAGAVTRFTGAL